MNDNLPRLPEPDLISYSLDSVMRKYEHRSFTEAQMRSYAEEAVKLLLPDALRYRHVRTLSIRAFGDLSTRNFEGEGAFDDLVDQDIELREEAIRYRKEPQ